jgi:hypothetical protein
METRYPIPYFSALKVLLHEGRTDKAVKDQQGNQGTVEVAEKAQIRCHLTGWLNGQVVQANDYIFESMAATGPKMEDILAAASSLGVDVPKTLNEAFDAIAELFPQTAEQPAGSSVMGSPVYLRPDAFEANMHPTTKKSITIKVGVYDDAEFTKLMAYVHLSFEDGETKRERLAVISQLQETLAQVQTNLTAMDALIALKQSNAPIPSGEYNEYLTSKTVAELQQLRVGIIQEIAQRQSQLAQLNQVLNKDLSTLIGSGAEDDTPLQKKFMNCVAALCTSILLTLKASTEKYKNIDVAAIMALFAPPDIT